MPSCKNKIFPIIGSLLSLAFVTGISFTASAQNLYYHDYVKLAEEAMADNQYEQAATHYEQAFNRYVGLPNHRADYARTLKQLGMEEQSLDQLFFALDSLHLHGYTGVLEDPCFNHWEQPGLLDRFRHRADSILAVHLKHFNAPYRDQLLRIGVYDQSIRMASGILEESEQVTDTVMQDYWKALRPIDSLNTVILTELIEAHGFPDVDVVGSEANSSAWAILMHAPLKVEERYMPMLEASCRRGQTPMKYYAFLHDRMINNVGSFQVKYGCTFLLGEGGNYYAKPINPPCTNFYREQVGLPPLEGFARDVPCTDP